VTGASGHVPEQGGQSAATDQPEPPTRGSGLAVLATAAAARTAHAAGSLVAGYQLSFLIAAGLILGAALLVLVQLRPRGSPDDADVHQPSAGTVPAPVLAECQLRKC
jgi:hypothetical protein